jgi:hypothetical protein
VHHHTQLLCCDGIWLTLPGPALIMIILSNWGYGNELPCPALLFLRLSLALLPRLLVLNLWA